MLAALVCERSGVCISFYSDDGGGSGYTERKAHLAVNLVCDQFICSKRKELAEYTLRRAAFDVKTVFAYALLAVRAFIKDGIKITSGVVNEILEEIHLPERNLHILIHGNGKFSFKF